MITNYYTIAQVVHELTAIFAGKTVHDAFSQQRGELVISFSDTSSVIMIGCEPSANFLYARNTFSRSHKNSFTAFTAIQQTTLCSVSLHRRDRAVTFVFENGMRLIAELFGSKANIVLVDTSSTITDAFLKKRLLIGQPYEERPTQTADISMEQLKQHIISATDDLPAELKKLYPKFGNVLIREWLYRTGLPDRQPASPLTENELQRLCDIHQQLMQEFTSSPSPRIYFEDSVPVRLAPIALHHLRDLHAEIYSTVSDAILMYLASAHREKRFSSQKELLMRSLEREAEHTEHTLEKLHAEQATIQQAEVWEHYGKLITAQLHNIQKGDTEVLVEDGISGTNELIAIPLDTHLAPAKNAERYFEKAKKLRRTAEEQAERIAGLSHHLNLYSECLASLGEISTQEELQSFLAEHEHQLAHLGITATKSRGAVKEQPLPFRVFTVAGGFHVWAGKSSENNDLLTTRHTAKNDLWFHARGVGGSHVVLKVGTGKGEVSKQAITQTAGIAAYYSKMKNASMVPVTMCEGKYVRKPKGVPSGTVYVEREQTIFAEPALPDHASPEQ